MMKGFKVVMAKPHRLRAVLKAGRLGQMPLVRDGAISAHLGPLKGWTAYRRFPALAKPSFREHWPGLQAELKEKARRASVKEHVQLRLKQIREKRTKKTGGIAMNEQEQAQRQFIVNISQRLGQPMPKHRLNIRSAGAPPFSGRNIPGPLRRIQRA